MAKIYNFDDSNEFGKKGERIVKNTLARLYPELIIEDKSNDRVYQSKDIDAVVKSTKHNNQRQIEIKTDSYDTSGNIAYEIISNTTYNTLGCLEKTEADTIFYYFPHSDVLYTFAMPDLRNWHREMHNKHPFEARKVFNKDKITLCHLISRKELEKQPFTHRYNNFSQKGFSQEG